MKEYGYVPNVRELTINEKVAADKAARKLAEQKNQQFRITKRKQATIKVFIGAVFVGVTVGLLYLGKQSGARESEAYDAQTQQLIDEHVNDRLGYNIPDEEVKQAKIEFIENYYSPETIEALKASILNEYNSLIDDITKTDDLIRDNNAKSSLDSDRIHNTIDDLEKYKDACKEDKTNYAEASDSDRVNVAANLNNVKLNVLQARLVEAQEKGKNLTEGSLEYSKSQETIQELTGQVNGIKQDLATLSDRALELQFEVEAQGKIK